MCSGHDALDTTCYTLYDEINIYDVVMTYGDAKDGIHTDVRKVAGKRSRFKASLLVWRLFLLVQATQLFSLVSGDYYEGYVSHIMRNHTTSACETSVPGYLFIRCPQMTTIAIQGAMYGRKVPSSKMCPVYSSILSPVALLGMENTNCEAETSLAKAVTVCQDKRVCQLLVHPREFGNDPCPDTSKYLTVTYKCRLKTESFRKRGSCQDAAIRLRCPRGAASTPNVVAVYNVTLTRNAGCSNVTLKNCSFSTSDVMGYVTDRCHRQRRCTIPVPRHLCGNYVHVEYSCVPEVVLTRHLPSPNLSMVHSTSDVINELSNVTSSTTILLPTTTREAVIIPKLAAVPQLSTGTTSSRTTIVDSAITSQTSLVVTSSTDLASQDLTTVLPIIATVTPTKREATQNTVVIQPTSAVRESSIEAVNEFPLSGFGEKGVTTAGNQSSNTGGTSSKTPMSDVEIATVGDAGAATSTGFMFIRSIAALVIFIRENSDQVLIIFLASISSGLFLTVCVLLCRRGDFPSITKKKKKETQPHREDSASLLGNRETSQQSRTCSSSTGNNVINAQDGNSNRRVSHINYIHHVQGNPRKRKHRSRFRSVLVTYCSCCCTNAPWQRDASHADDESYQIARQSTSLSDDDVISAVANTRNHFESEPAPVFAPNPQLESTPTSENQYQTFSAGSEVMRYADDDTSEYEFQDDVTPTPPARPTTLRTNPNVVPVIPNGQRGYSTAYRSPRHYNTHVQSRQFTQPNVREPPPFPKTSSYTYQISPHYATHRIAYHNSFQPGNDNNQHTQQHHPVAYPTSFGDHYVSLQPQLRQPTNARTLTIDQTDSRLERRDSFYDNSLPRDSPLFEYYQRQNRPELPGTRNLNQYYS